MTTPALAAWRFGTALVCGAALGAVYSFLKPMRPRAVGDLLFLGALFYGWLWLSFAICRGDIRLGYTAGLFVGMGLWELTLGKWLRPVFSGFWKAIGRIIGALLYPFQKIFQKFRQFRKFIFASLKKWVTIKWNNRRYARRKTGGPHGTDQKIPGIHQTGIQENPGTDQDRGVGNHRIVYGSTSGAPWRD